MYSETPSITITPVSNGWIVQVPPARQNDLNEIMPGFSLDKLQDFFKAMATGMDAAVDDPAIIEHKRQRMKEAEELLNAATKGIVKRDQDVFIFGKFTDVLDFLQHEYVPTDEAGE